MGDLNVKIASSGKEQQEFTKLLLKDVQALSKLLEQGRFDIEVTRIGAEQELCLIDKNYRPSPNNLEILEKSPDTDLTSELARFNMEANFDPLVFEKDCFSKLEENIQVKLNHIREIANELETDIILTGILPTIRKFDMKMDNLTPLDRYHALMESLKILKGEDYELKISGIDELLIKHDSALLESCNTGFQVHMQIKPDEFAKKYNVAQAICGPTLAVAVNSPLLFGKRLWSETRIALFQQSIDTRRTSEHLRESSPRVTFGEKWLDKSILEIYKEDIVRFRVILGTEVDEDSIEMVNKGKTPSLRALTVHNSTVYRWNRPCYGIKDGIAHLRIENRVLPAGPTVLDEVANAAFWLGLMNGFEDKYPDIAQVMRFEDAKNNFYLASRHGLETQFKWVNGKSYSAQELIKNELLSIARNGLKKAKINKADIEKYLGVIEARNDTGKTGSKWTLDSFASLKEIMNRDEVISAITAATVNHQRKNMPIHEWPLATGDDITFLEPSAILVEEYMTTDLFTVRKDDVIELAADMMDWKKIRYVPVEDKSGKLVGLITSRNILRFYRENVGSKKDIGKALVEDIMITNPSIVSPYSKITEAISILEKKQIGCLPVVKNEKLVGILTEQNSLHLSSRLFKRLIKNNY
ncbi:MAG: CBS domain-containing protein/gamma-glutamylcysteine synthetase [Sphingobacteriales bacterium]